MFSLAGRQLPAEDHQRSCQAQTHRIVLSLPWSDMTSLDLRRTGTCDRYDTIIFPETLSSMQSLVGSDLRYSDLVLTISCSAVTFMMSS